MEGDCPSRMLGLSVLPFSAIVLRLVWERESTCSAPLQLAVDCRGDQIRSGRFYCGLKAYSKLQHNRPEGLAVLEYRPEGLALQHNRPEGLAVLEYRYRMST